MSIADKEYPDFVRKNESGYDVAYYGMATAIIADRTVVVSEWEAGQINMTVNDPVEVPEFVTAPYIQVGYGDCRTVDIYVQSKADLIPVCEELAKTWEKVSIYAQAVYLATWKDGKLIHGPVNLDHFYQGVSQEDLDMCSL